MNPKHYLSRSLNR